MRLGSTLLVVCALGLLAGCPPIDDGNYAPWPSPPPGTRGELYEGLFTHNCIDPSDAACDSWGGTQANLNSDIALGSHFDVSFHDGDGTGASARVESASSERLGEIASGFEALKEGRVALYATRSEVIDILHVTITKADHVTIERNGTPVSSVEFSMDDVVTLRAVPYSSGSRELAGALFASWSTDDPEVVTPEQVNDNRTELVPKAPGTATLTVQIGSLEVQHVTVKYGLEVKSMVLN